MRIRTLLALASVGLLLAATTAAAQTTFRWRNAQGVVHYSNLLQPSAVERGYEVLNGSGRIIKRVPAPLTPKQRAAAEAEAKRLEKQARARAAQARRDNMLLRTFDSVKAIIRLRDSRLGALDRQLHLVRARERQLAASLQRLRRHEANVTATGRGVPASMRREDLRLNAQLADTRATLDGLKAQRASTKRSFQADIARFKQLQAEGRVLP